MKRLTQLLAHAACKNGESISPDVVHFLCCCVASSVVQRMQGGGGEGAKRKGRKSQPKLHKKGPVWEFNINEEHKNGP